MGTQRRLQYCCTFRSMRFVSFTSIAYLPCIDCHVCPFDVRRFYMTCPVMLRRIKRCRHQVLVLLALKTFLALKHAGTWELLVRVGLIPHAEKYFARERSECYPFVVACTFLERVILSWLHVHSLLA